MFLTINIRKYLVGQPRTKRARKAVIYLRGRIAHFTKTDIENVRIGQDLNNMIVKKYSKTMAPVRMSVKIEGGKATAEPFKQEVQQIADSVKSKDKKQETEKKEPAKK